MSKSTGQPDSGSFATERQKILIVDDKEANLFALRDVLKKIDAEVISADSGQAALALVLEHDFALILLDVRMPDMDGYEVAEYLKSDATTRAIPIIFVTAEYPDEKHIFKGYESGAMDYMLKPYSPKILLSKVHVLLELDRDKKELLRHRNHLEDMVSQRTAELARTTNELMRFSWLLEKENPQTAPVIPSEYGDLTALNQNGLILNSVGKPMLETLSNDVMDLLDTCVAVYEKNGDYAFGTFVSVWCGTLDNASRRLCKTDDDAQALNCGNWLCHESCWEISKKALESGDSVDQECCGGLHIYAVPIRSGDEIIGVINFGYGTPPADLAKQKKLAERYNITPDRLRKSAEAYKPRPPFIIEVAKRRLQSSALLIGQIVSRQKTEKALQTRTDEVEKANRELNTARLAALNMMEDALRDKDLLEKNDQVQNAVIQVLHTRISDLQEFLDEALDEAIRLTDSKIGYIYFYDENEKQFILNSWSKDVMKECGVMDPQTCYELDKTGIWGEAVRQRKPILLNHFNADHPHRKGVPKGHVALQNFLTVPIFELDRIVAVIGVANKTSDYDPQDVRSLQLFMDSVWATTKDIQAQQALKTSEEMMRSSQAVAHICSYSTHLIPNEIETSQWVCSPEFYNLFGIDESYPHTIAGWARFIHPDHRDEMVAYHESVVRDKKEFDKEYKIIRIDDGAERWVHGTGQLEFDEKGTPIRMYGAIQDITEQKLVEIEREEARRQLAENLARFNEAQESGHIGTWEYLVEEDAHVWSVELCRIFGFESGIELPPWEQMRSSFPDDWDKINALVQGAVNGTPYNEDVRLTRPDGTVRWVQTQCSLVKNEDGKVVRLIGTGQDITDRKEAEIEREKARKQLNESLALLNESQTAGHIGSWEYDIVEDRITWSDEMYRIAGIEVGAPLPGWEKMHTSFPEDWDRLDAAVQGAIKGAPYNEDFRILWPDGTIRWGRVQGNPVRDENGTVVRLIGTTQDITERKKAQEKIEFEQTLFKSFMDIIPAAVYFKDTEGRFINVNKAKCLELGLPAEEIIGKSDTDFMPEDQTERSRADELRVMETEKVLQLEDRSDDRWFFSTKAPRYDESGHIAGTLGISWDITEQKQAQKQILFEQTLFKNFMDMLPALVYFKDLDGRYIRTNQAKCEQFGKPEDEIIGKTVYDFFEKDLAERLQQEELQVMRSEQSVELEQQLEGHWYFTTKAPHYDENGNLAGMFCISWTIDDRKQAEIDLADSRQFLRTIIDTIPGRVWWKDLDSRFIGANLNFARDAGLNHPDEFIGKTDFDIWVKEEAEGFVADDREVIESGKPKLNIEEFTTRPDGGIRWLETNKIPLRNPEGTIVGTVGTYQDITDRKQAENELRRLSAAIEQSPEIIVITDVQGIIQYANPAFETITGYSRDKALGQTPSILKSGQHSAEFYERLWATLSNGRIWNGRFINKRKDGSLYTEEAVISPVKSPDGTITNYVAVKRDITAELKQAEYLQQAQKMEAVGQLAGGIAHDFNNILQAILGFSDLLLMTLDETQEKPRENVSQIQKAAKHAATLTRQLLAYSRKQEMELGQMDINQAIQNASSFINSIIGETIEIIQQLDPDLPPAKADTQQIERVLLNLALNARDAMPGGGELTLRTECVRFSEQDADASQNIRPGQFVCVCVTDTGTGMSKETMDHIFEPFFTTKGVGKGTGLGLSAIYGIIQDHHGWVSVYSEPGRGTTFKVFLPAEPGREASRSLSDGDQHIPAAMLGNKERVLIVEDDLPLLTLSETALLDAGYITQTASTKEEAQNLFDEQNGAFDLLFCDLILSDGSGADLAKHLLKKNPNLAILLCSGYAEETIQQKQLSETDYIFLEKPFSIVKLLETARTALDHKRAE